MLDATIQNLYALATWCLGLMHPYPKLAFWICSDLLGVYKGHWNENWKYYVECFI